MALTAVSIFCVVGQLNELNFEFASVLPTKEVRQECKLILLAGAVVKDIGRSGSCLVCWGEFGVQVIAVGVLTDSDLEDRAVTVHKELFEQVAVIPTDVQTLASEHFTSRGKLNDHGLPLPGSRTQVGVGLSVEEKSAYLAFDDALLNACPRAQLTAVASLAVVQDSVELAIDGLCSAIDSDEGPVGSSAEIVVIVGHLVL